MTDLRKKFRCMSPLSLSLSVPPLSPFLHCLLLLLLNADASERGNGMKSKPCQLPPPLDPRLLSGYNSNWLFLKLKQRADEKEEEEENSSDIYEKGVRSCTSMMHAECFLLPLGKLLRGFFSHSEGWLALKSAVSGLQLIFFSTLANSGKNEVSCINARSKQSWHNEWLVAVAKKKL